MQVSAAISAEMAGRRNAHFPELALARPLKTRAPSPYNRPGLVLAVADELGERDQRGGARGLKVIQLRDGLLDEVLGNLLALLNAQQLGVRRLVYSEVLGGRLAQHLRRLRDV